MRTVFSAGNGEVEIYEFVIPPEWADTPLSDLVSGNNVRAMSITRTGKAFLPENSEILQEGDILHLGATFEGAEYVRRQLEQKG